ncbi:carboxyltransferase domain-containing protein [Kineococcus rubinsiae]|uniref:5-oxoprolinase subunit B/C family protein n=1 Tax=Kineococcus rubinsiae TaxID=2609562 RepID=UPI001430259B|nr:carboxyltransferase domain-containing protein [Kineococcus rubinsiae]NIZ91696.1 carboxyltransferase domain-containing protein [Kineococcus rubinsiae]
MRFLPAGSGALLVEVADLDQALALFASLRDEPVEGVGELVPAARTVLVRFDPDRTEPRRIAAAVAGRSLARAAAADGELVEVPVHYDGEDLDEVARLCGFSAEEVVRRHTAATYSVAFTGFAPGFAYLAGGDPALHVPRRRSPRTSIPAGSVGLAGEFSGVYPRASPGGWQLLGRTDVPVWDLGREVPALLQPGARVRFTDAAGTPAPPPPAARDAVDAPDDGGPALVVVATAPLILVQDLGRPGHAGLGVSASGAVDRGALRRANLLVGNAPGAAALEVAGGGLRLRARGNLVVGLAGAPAALTRSTPRGNRSVPAGTALALDDGEELLVGPAPAGVYSVLAVRGGLAVDLVLGSAATDVLAGIGPPPPRAGDVLRVRDGAALSAVALDAGDPSPLPAAGDVVTLDVVPGPRADWFTPAALATLTAQEWTVTPRSNRVGLRLHGEAPLERAQPGELPSEGTVAGALQVPPDGQPVLFTADHPLTGGYPVIACVAAHHLGLAAQVPATGRLRFRVVPQTPGGTP